MRISTILQNKSPAFSFEFFPPKTDADGEALFRTAETLRALHPDFITVTWGAGGGTRRKTLDITSSIKSDLGVETMAHLTCVGASRNELDEILDEIVDRGIENILALRGDPPRGQKEFIAHPDGFTHASELVQHISSRWDLCIGVAGYPEGHPEARDREEDLRHLKAKVEAGASFVTTQLFFDNEMYFRFVDRARRIGIDVPILPGIMPVTNVKQLRRFTGMCGASIPSALATRLETIQADGEAVVSYGIEYASAQCEALLAGGAPGVHFYTLNRSHSTVEILKNLRST
jgi:methylenetetrahydrofolate reductase (NADPH)